jgi:hypothetical protein
VHNLVDDDQISELASFEALFTVVSYGPGVPLEGTCKPLGPPSYVLINDCKADKKNKIMEGRFKKSANLMWHHRLDRLFKSDMRIITKVK